MEIVCIFEHRLYAMRYEGESQNELARLLERWQDTFYVSEFIKEHIRDINWTTNPKQVFELITQNVEHLENLIIEAKDPEFNFGRLFRPLHNQEYRTSELAKQKGPNGLDRRRNCIRLYAIKIDEDCFVITGGAIKFHHLMEDRPHTNEELTKLNRVRDFLANQGVFDTDSFQEFLFEL